MSDRAVALVALAGWAAITYALATWLSPLVWALSVGFLLLSLVGWRVLAHLALHGIAKYLRVK